LQPASSLFFPSFSPLPIEGGSVERLHNWATE
jgi:hypothetical protein